jgi:hypothetical protein
MTEEQHERQIITKVWPIAWRMERDGSGHVGARFSFGFMPVCIEVRCMGGGFWIAEESDSERTDVVASDRDLEALVGVVRDRYIRGLRADLASIVGEVSDVS